MLKSWWANQVGLGLSLLPTLLLLSDGPQSDGPQREFMGKGKVRTRDFLGFPSKILLPVVGLGS